MISRFSSPKFHGAASGFTLIELLMVILIVSILAFASVEVFSDAANDSRFQETVNRMNQIKDALVGNPDLKVDGTRTHFGFVGDIGALPTALAGLQALLNNSSGYGAHQVSSSARIGYGWNGPYIDLGNPSATTIKDGWGRAFLYTYTSVFQATITSYGADGAVGGTGLDQDLTVTISESSAGATLFGFVCENTGPYDSSAQIELSYPDGSGGLTQSLQTVTAGMNGAFTFFSVPFGVRSITVYKPTKAGATTTKGPRIIVIDKPNVVVPCSLIDLGT